MVFALKLTVRSQICNTSDRIALYFNVRTEHLANEWLQPAKLHDEKFVISYGGQRNGNSVDMPNSN